MLVIKHIMQVYIESEFHLATKIWGGSEINEWAYSARQLPGDVENFFNSSRLFWVIFDQKQMLVV